ncbi:unnamed protein product [Leptosia nina]|uniref:Fibroin light chain n=1 Tax=Leptosia nina TaxID=320188 RepID=A0AAV1J3B3_9NEOP
MLPFVLVLLAAQSAFGAPSTASVSFYNVNEIPSVPDNGGLVNSFLISGPLDYIDGGDISLYAQMAIQILSDKANSADPVSKASAVIEAIAALGEISHGIPGDSCEAAALSNAFAYSVGSGNNGGLRQAIANYVSHLSSNIDAISQLIVNPNAVRYSAGPRGNCLGGGRSYSFDDTWDAIINSASAGRAALLNEEYCVAKRMYNSFNVKSNTFGAALTASNIPQITQLAQYTVQPLAQFLRTVASGANPLREAAAAKAALAQGISKIQLNP